ncbi:MAG: 50S ribosomal protein L18 [bacterium]|nr:50S ribosomal protein L18 [bacterium]
MATLSRKTRRQHRHRRVRSKVVGTATRPRLAVFRSAKHITAQVIDDAVGKTLVSVTDKQLPAAMKGTKAQTQKVAVAEAVGKLVAEKAKAKKITSVVYDAAGYRYHGRVKALADGARAGGLKF